jgi:hypothetical protein
MKRLTVKLALALLSVGILVGCASTGAPMPPSLELPKPPSDLRATRKGHKVNLTWTVPSETTDRQSVRHLGATRICRSLEPAMQHCGSPVGEVLTGKPVGTARKRAVGENKAGGRAAASYTDILPAPLEKQNPTGEVTYAIEALNTNGRSAGLSNQVRVSIAPTFPPPGDFKAQVTRDGIVITFTGMPDQHEAPEISHRYRIYRREEGSDRETLNAEVPLEKAGEVEGVDHAFEWEKSYDYRATVVTIVSRSSKPPMEVEGDDTPAAKIFAHDVYPPGVPTGLQAVFSGEGQRPFVDLLWAPDTDADLADYNVYRREEGGQPVKINTELVKTTAYRDIEVQRGKRYFYSVSAVDLRGNESERSEEASEEVPEGSN